MGVSPLAVLLVTFSRKWVRQSMPANGHRGRTVSFTGEARSAKYSMTRVGLFGGTGNQGEIRAAPVLKWAGGKSQLLPTLLSHVPLQYGKYIEPFVGGGALFFALSPSRAVIADSNPELINVYRVIASEVEALISELESMPTDRDTFYRVRAELFGDLEPLRAAARTIYLNKTCFNGLFRVNRAGQFNVPYANANRRACQPERLRAAASLLRNAEIVVSDYHALLTERAEPGDFVYLDPPYVPTSRYSDFKRYTKEQFYEEDHRRLAGLVGELAARDCHLLITNSDHPLVWDLYKDFRIDVIHTRRYINKNGDGRRGRDVVIYSK